MRHAVIRVGYFNVMRLGNENISNIAFRVMSFFLSMRDVFKKGQLIIVATDGIWEGHNKAGEMFGKPRLQSLISTYASSNAQTMINAIFNEHLHFTQDAKREDDLTMVIVKIT